MFKNNSEREQDFIVKLSPVNQTMYICQDKKYTVECHAPSGRLKSEIKGGQVEVWEKKVNWCIVVASKLISEMKA